MSQIYVDPEARHPLAPQVAIPLSRVRPGVQIVTLDTMRGNLALTVLASEWRAESVPIVTSNGFPLRSIIRLRADDLNRDAVDLVEKGIHPPVEASEFWNYGRVSVETERDDILTFYPWLVKEGFMRAANEIEDTFFEYFVDAATYWDRLVRQSSE